MLGLIDEAETSIDFIQLEFHYDPGVKRIQDALRSALKRGVLVRGLVEDGIDFNVRSVRHLRRYGIDAKLDTPRKKTHNKLFIIDGGAVLLGSTNLSGVSMERNNETNVLIRDTGIGRFFQQYFEMLWEDSWREPGMEPFTSGGVTVILNRSYFTHVHRLLREATSSIRVMLYGMRYDARRTRSPNSRLIDALVQARSRGVDTRVFLDKSGYNAFLDEINQETARHLEAGGVEVRFDDESVNSHSKLIWVDGVVVIGSVNWGYDALARRNEASVLIRDEEISAFFLRYFDTLWEGRTWP